MTHITKRPWSPFVIVGLVTLVLGWSTAQAQESPGSQQAEGKPGQIQSEQKPAEGQVEERAVPRPGTLPGIQLPGQIPSQKPMQPFPPGAVGPTQPSSPSGTPSIPPQQGPVFAFFVNGYGGCCIPLKVCRILSSLGATVHVSNWNDILNLSTQPCEPGGVTQTGGNPGGWPPYEISLQQQNRPVPLHDDDFVKALATKIKEKKDLDESSPVIVIGHSFGGDSILQVAKKPEARRIDFLGILDAVGRAALRANVTRPVPSTVGYFFNRWEWQCLPSIEGPPPPIDYGFLGLPPTTRLECTPVLLGNLPSSRAGNLPSSAGRTSQEGWLFEKNEDCNTRWPPNYLSHKEVATNPCVQRELWTTLAGRFFNLRIIDGKVLRPSPLFVNGLQVTFNKPINPATFTVEDVQASIRVTGVHVVPNTQNRAFEIRFDPVVTAVGPELQKTRTLFVGPNIEDADNLGDIDADGYEDALFNLMDQNQNGIGGELNDTYAFNITTDGSMVLGGLVDDITAELIGDAQADIRRTLIGQIIIHFIRPLNPSRAGDMRTHRLVQPGKDQRFGTPDDSVIGLKSAVYDPDALTVTLTPNLPLAQNQVLQIGVSGLTDPSGNPVDGDGDGIPGGDFVGTLALGTRLSFFDRDADHITLTLENGGVMEMRILPGKEGPELFLLGTNPTQSLLSGRVTPSQLGGDGKITFGSINGMKKVRNQLPQSMTIKRTSPHEEISQPLGVPGAAVGGMPR